MCKLFSTNIPCRLCELEDFNRREGLDKKFEEPPRREQRQAKENAKTRAQSLRKELPNAEELVGLDA